jgi:hypothetical protein
MPSTVTLTGPGTATVTDDAAAEIIALTKSLEAQNLLLIGTPSKPGSLYSIMNGLATITSNLGAVADVSKGLSKALSDLDVALSVMASAQSVQNSLTAALVANQIQTNNFQVAATKEALARTDQPEPVVPTVKEQLIQGAKDSITLTTAAATEGAIIQQVQTTAVHTAGMISETEIYKDIATWLKRQKDAFLTFVTPSAKSLANTQAAETGTPPSQ